VAVRDANVREGKARILGQREFEICNGGGHIFLGAGLPESAALEVEVVRFKVFWLSLGQAHLVPGV